MITAALLVALGIGRSLVSERRPVAAVVETGGVAVATVLVSLAVGQLADPAI